MRWTLERCHNIIIIIDCQRHINHSILTKWTRARNTAFGFYRQRHFSVSADERRKRLRWLERKRPSKDLICRLEWLGQFNEKAPAKRIKCTWHNQTRQKTNNNSKIAQEKTMTMIEKANQAMKANQQHEKTHLFLSEREKKAEMCYVDDPNNKSFPSVVTMMLIFIFACRRRHNCTSIDSVGWRALTVIRTCEHRRSTTFISDRLFAFFCSFVLLFVSDLTPFYLRHLSLTCTLFRHCQRPHFSSLFFLTFFLIGNDFVGNSNNISSQNTVIYVDVPRVSVILIANFYPLWCAECHNFLRIRFSLFLCLSSSIARRCVRFLFFVECRIKRCDTNLTTANRGSDVVAIRWRWSMTQ